MFGDSCRVFTAGTARVSELEHPSNTSEQHYYIDKGGLKTLDHRKYSTNCTTQLPHVPTCAAPFPLYLPAFWLDVLPNG
ncbi:hypothetical protein MAR_036521 [Mya arenaria]|uniref:Uncharacterized protein n=1 Tax=Mya arenaria TaxID=6604 RepID=A0ABY7FL37_MYAAR|nr:hypothetical protein MAR_036521 [Mya arenaria]